MRVSDGKILGIIKKWLKAPISEGGKLSKCQRGTPQGGVISPLLANIYLNHLDRFWKKRGYYRHAKLVRYADDFVILCKENPEFYLKEVHRLLSKLELELNNEKTRIVDGCTQGFDFLGFYIKKVWVYRPKRKCFGWITGIRLSCKALKKARREVNNIVGKSDRKSPVPIQILVDRVNQWIRHWLPYYSYSNDRQDMRNVYLNIILARLVRAKVARSNGIKRRCGKWKSWNPKYWAHEYGLIDMVEAYYNRRKQLYAALYEHPINAMA
jgi:hypothetical protein